jgi:phosphoribosyl-ATP pyrophosphohydrolase / phosphoribosyl-AMP cyclohydrolase / histidinol dehydrogenase
MTSVPYPSFSFSSNIEDRYCLAGVGRCRISIAASTHDDGGPSITKKEMIEEVVKEDNDENGRNEIRTILKKCLEQANVVFDSNISKEQEKERKQLQKKYMKQSVAMASKYLQQTCQLDVSITDVEVFICNTNEIIRTAGNYTRCFLDAGCARIVIPYDVSVRDHTSFQQLLNVIDIPRDRLIVHLTSLSSWKEFDASLLEQFKDDCHAISLCVGKDISKESLCQILEVSKSVRDMDVIVQIDTAGTLFQDNPQSLADLVGTVLQTSTPKDRSGTTISIIDPTPELLGLSYAACIVTDRPDGLYTTVVCTRTGEALGLVYSSPSSVVAALQCGRGVYYSRSRNGLWRKGDTSGHYQTLHRMDVDCDGDALRFTVTQNSPSSHNHPDASSTSTPNLTPVTEAAFCHLDTFTCWGAPRGVRHLEATLRDRLHNSPEGSYTQRLFQDPILLRNKLVEEAQELSEADTAQHVAEELADVLYFSLVRAAQFGIGLDDAVAELDRRARKVTRRAGDSKEFRITAAQTILTTNKFEPEITNSNN